MIHIVTLERDPIRTVPGFFRALEDNVDYAQKVMEGVWIVDTKLSPRDLSNLLLPHLIQSDQLLVIQARNNLAGWLQRQVWDWLGAARNHSRF